MSEYLQNYLERLTSRIGESHIGYVLKTLKKVSKYYSEDPRFVIYMTEPNIVRISWSNSSDFSKTIESKIYYNSQIVWNYKENNVLLHEESHPKVKMSKDIKNFFKLL